MTAKLAGFGDGAEIRSELVFVVYESRNGEIRHIHRAFDVRADPSQEEEASQALEMARRFGHTSETLRTLQVDPRGPDPGIALRVDVDRQELVMEDGDGSGARASRS